MNDTLPDWAEEGLKALAGMPLKECDMCSRSAEIYATLHDCQDMVMCASHWIAWLDAVNARFSINGWLSCEHCELPFSDITCFVSSRLV